MRTLRPLLFVCWLACSLACASLHLPSPVAGAATAADVPAYPPAIAGQHQGQWGVEAEARVGGPELPGGGLIACPLPAELHKRNIGSPPPNGPGCCVFRSLDHASRWQNVPALWAFPEWMVANKVEGGGYPQKVVNLVARICKSRGVPVPPYVQIEDADLEVLKLACKGGRMPCVTYGISPTGRYNGNAINHMVNLVHASDTTFVILDNNYVNSYEHMSPTEFSRAYRTVGDQRGRPTLQRNGWSIVLLNYPPPPVVN